jgi:hypothetical protein
VGGKMKESRTRNIKRLLCLFILGLVILGPALLEAQRVYVRGYYRKDGTYVKPHYRTSPDGSPYNNYSYPGNYNPNTGEITTGDPAKYLERYYGKKKSRLGTRTVNVPRATIAYSHNTQVVQSALSLLGYDVGPIDGIIGPRTRLAIMLFQIDHGLRLDGIAGPLTLKALSTALRR